MAVRTPSLPSEKQAAKVREELERVLHSRAFRQVERLQCFLSFIVGETLAGRGDGLKEFLIGIEVFGKDSSFDPRTDPIVRVQARRLDPHNRVGARVEGGIFPEYLDADEEFFEAVAPAGQRLAHDKAQEALQALHLSKCPAVEYPLELFPYLGGLLFRRQRRGAHRHADMVSVNEITHRQSYRRGVSRKPYRHR